MGGLCGVCVWSVWVKSGWSVGGVWVECEVNISDFSLITIIVWRRGGVMEGRGHF